MTITSSVNEGNLIRFLRSKDIAEWNKIILKIMKKMKKDREKNGSEIYNFLSTLFRNKDFILQQSPILADVKNLVFYWIRIIDLL